MESVFNRLFRGREGKKASHADSDLSSTLPSESIDVQTAGIPLVPDNCHLQHVGRTAQGNGYWITLQLAIEEGESRDFVAAYVFDKTGYLISCDVVDQGRRNQSTEATTEKVVQRLKHKIDARQTEEIWVKPFSVSFYGHTFGLIAREVENGYGETVIDAMPGWTLMFHGPWSRCNYSS